VNILLKLSRFQKKLRWELKFWKKKSSCPFLFDDFLCLRWLFHSVLQIGKRLGCIFLTFVKWINIPPYNSYFSTGAVEGTWDWWCFYTKVAKSKDWWCWIRVYSNKIAKSWWGYSTTSTTSSTAPVPSNDCNSYAQIMSCLICCFHEENKLL